jgi:hypothetical protein
MRFPILPRLHAASNKLFEHYPANLPALSSPARAWLPHPPSCGIVGFLLTTSSVRMSDSPENRASVKPSTRKELCQKYIRSIQRKNLTTTTTQSAALAVKYHPTTANPVRAERRKRLKQRAWLSWSKLAMSWQTIPSHWGILQMRRQSDLEYTEVVFWFGKDYVMAF